MELKKERILFISPTRQLCKNVYNSTIEYCIDNLKWKEKNTKSIQLWTGETYPDNYKSRISKVSKNNMESFEGELTITTPETLYNMLINSKLIKGHTDFGPLTFISSFDKIVFDEFHLTTEKMFVLGLLFSYLIVHLKDEGFDRTKTLFLSATPIDIKDVLMESGIDEKYINEISEEIIEEDNIEETRCLHGDVKLNLINENIEISNILNVFKEKILNVKNKDGSILFIIDSLKDIISNEKEFLKQIIDMGFNEEEIFISNSISDQISGKNHGKEHDISKKKFIIASSTVEVGITIKNLQLCIMGEGFNPASFLQRFGRVARGNINGEVYIYKSNKKRINSLLSNELEKIVKGKYGEPISIKTLSINLSKYYNKKFKLKSIEKNINNNNLNENSMPKFGSLSGRSYVIFGLFYNRLLEEYKKNNSQNKKKLKDVKPNISNKISYLMKVLEKDPYFIKIFYSELDNLRDFSQTMKLLFHCGKEIETSVYWISKNTDILDRYSIVYDDENKPVVSLDEDFSEKHKLMRDESNKNIKQEVTLYRGVYGEKIVEFKKLHEEVKEIKNKLEYDDNLNDDERKIMNAMLNIINMTGVFPISYSSEITSYSNSI